VRGKNSDLADEGDLEFYFVFDSVSDSEIVHFLPDIDNLPEEDLVNDGEVPKAYEVPRSLTASALEDEEIQGFKQANYQDIRDACHIWTKSYSISIMIERCWNRI